MSVCVRKREGGRERGEGEEGREQENRCLREFTDVISDHFLPHRFVNCVVLCHYM